MNNEITTNMWIWIAIGICLMVVLMAVYVPMLRGVLELTDPGAQGWVLIVLASFIPVVLGAVVNQVTMRTAGGNCPRLKDLVDA